MRNSVLALIVLAIVVGFGLAVVSIPRNQITQNMTHGVSTNSSPTCDFTGATPQTILSDFQSNQAAANSNWLGKTICFSDYVDSVNENSAGQYISCMKYGSGGIGDHSGCNDSLNTFDGWIIYYWANSEVAASVPANGQSFSASCAINAYKGYGSYASFGYKALILTNCLFG